MICQKCGRKIPQKSKFCMECGAEQMMENKEQTDAEERAERRKRHRWIGIGLAAAAIVCAAVLCGKRSIKATIDLNDYITISFEGWDSNGKAVVKFDHDRFKRKYEKQLKKNCRKSLTDSMSEHKYEQYQKDLMNGLLGLFQTDDYSGLFLADCVDGSVNHETGLSNGDVIKYTWKCDEETAEKEYGYKMEYRDIEIKVSGLKKVKEFDPFEGVEVTYHGVTSQGTASVEGKAPVKAGESLNYIIDQDEGLSNGDSITVRVYVPLVEDTIQYCADRYGMIPSVLTKTYKVEGLERNE